MFSARYGIYRSVNDAIRNRGFYGVFSFRNYFGTQKNCLRLKRLSDGAQSDFGYKNGYLDIPSIIIWAGSSQLEIVYWYCQLSNLYAQQWTNVPGLTLEIISNEKALAQSTDINGMYIRNIPYHNVKVTSAWDNEGLLCYNSSLPRLQFQKYNNNSRLLGVLNKYSIVPQTEEELTRTQIVTYNSDVDANQTSIRNQYGVSLVETGVRSNTIFHAGICMSDQYGYYKKTGTMHDIVIYHSSNLITEVEQSLITAHNAS